MSAAQPPEETEGGPHRPVAVVFDLDRTVTKWGTFTPFLLFAARGRPLKYLLAGPLLLAALGYKLGLISRGRLKELMLTAVLGGATRDEVAALAAAFVERRVNPGLRPGALRAIAAHRAEGCYLILATASFEFYVERLGHQLGFDRVVATRSLWDEGGRLVGRIDGENCYGAEKLRRLEEALPGLSADYRVVAYSDSHADEPLLRWADRGIAVNPTRRLRRRAQAGDFELVDWNR